MALEYKYCLSSYSSDCSETIFEDETVYGTLGNEERDEIAKKYLVYKVDVTGSRTLIELNNTPNPINISGQADPLLYVPDKILVPTQQDGWYKIITLIFTQYNAGTGYTAETSEGANDEDVIYYATTASFYKCIANVTGIAPDGVTGSDYWELIEDFTLYEDNISGTVISSEWDDVVTCYTERAFVKEITGEGLEAICEDCISFKEVEKVDLLFLWLNAMYAANNAGVYDKAEKVARHVENQKYLQ